jgi:hypothetical protein
MDSFQRFLENLPQMPLEERVQMFRHHALQSLNTAKGFAVLLQKDTEDCPELPVEVGDYFEVLVGKLDELNKLLDALV